jgi:hypothetical protein
VPLGPPEVHSEEHVRPVRRLGAAGAGTDGQDRAALVVFAREQEGGPLPAEVTLESDCGPVQLGRQLVVAGFLDELEGREEVVDPSLEAAPELDLGPQAVGFAKDLLRCPLVVPEAGVRGQRL